MEICKQLIIFGATGDLASLKLFPAIFELFEQGQLTENFQLIGYGRTVMEKQAFKDKFVKAVLDKFPESEQEILKLAEKVEYFSGSYDKQESFEGLAVFCKELAKGKDLDQTAYFSVPPNVFEELVKNLAVTLKLQCLNLKIVIEKPFGVDEKSAEQLFRVIGEHFEEGQVYLLDHFLGKRPIQSILKLRLENNVINLMIKPSEIANIQITALENLGVGQRTGYYDQVGCLKDMVQSHLLQVLALITMDIPLNPSIESLQREKNNILSAVRFNNNEEDIVFGQYQSYAESEGVAENSQTDTLAALKLNIDRRDWYNVPIYIRTGKKLNQALTRVVIEFKKMAFQSADRAANKLIFEIKPTEGVGLRLTQDRQMEKGEEIENLILEQSLACSTDFCLSDYASLLRDIMANRKNYFLSFPEIVASWKVIDGIEKLRATGKIMVHKYADALEGPQEYLNLPVRDGFKWN